jgi:hypothetical protein
LNNIRHYQYIYIYKYKNIQVNLTKLLSKASDSAQKDIFETFPSFLWILRDFSLKLVDEFGNRITPKEYLENGLKPLKGFSENIENKNKIR